MAMAALQITNALSTLSSCRRFRTSSLHAPPSTTSRRTPSNSLPKLVKSIPPTTTTTTDKADKFVAHQLYAVAEAAADRAEMHDIIGRQRDNWNHLFLHSANSMALTASAAAAVSSLASSPPALRLALKLSSAVLFAASTATMAIAAKIQPSQLAEEQRNATRLFRQLNNSIRTVLALRTPTQADVESATERVLALDKAYPLPLLPGMLDKFPKKMEPTVWWPHFNHTPTISARRWNESIENEMKGIVGLIKRKDVAQYVDFGNKLLAINRVLSVAAPALCGVATVGALLAGPLAVFVSVVGGALAAVANTLQHGGQAGMVVELSRNCAGFYENLGEEIEFNLGQEEVEKREDGDLLKLKVALRLGRSVSELRAFGRDDGDGVGEFAGKLF